MHPRRIWPVGLVSVAALSALFAAGGAARAADGGSSVCYKEVDLDGGPDGGDAAHVDRNNERVALNVHRQGDLTYPGGYTQTVYAAFGKNTDAEDANDIMAAAQGTIVVTTKGGSPRDFDHGAHMGLVAIWVRPDGAAKDYDCYSEQESATPTVWHCAVRDQDEKLKLDRATLTKMTHPDQYCGIFQDDVIENQP